jgi:hypothetical protein
MNLDPHHYALRTGAERAVPDSTVAGACAKGKVTARSDHQGGHHASSKKPYQRGVATRGWRPFVARTHTSNHARDVRAMVPGTIGPSFTIAEAGAPCEALFAMGVDRSEVNGCDGGPERIKARCSEASGERRAVDAGSAFPTTVATSWENAMSFFEVVVAAIVSLAPRLSGEQIDRYAADIAYVAHDNLDLALALVVVQDAESAWRESVETCKVTGDGGLAISSFQLHAHWLGGFSRQAVCRSNLLAAARAGHAMLVLARVGGMENALHLYVGCRATDPRATRRRSRIQQLQRLPAVRAFLRQVRAAA